MRYLFLIMSVVMLPISSSAFACKDRKVRDEYPIEEARSADVFIEAEVNNTTQEENVRYSPTTSFVAKVINSYKGGIPAGTTITVSAAIEEAHAVCPVSLVEHTKYLMLLSKRGDKLEISRFNYLVIDSSLNYSSYKKQIEAKF
jgi:hypothetical protein